MNVFFGEPGWTQSDAGEIGVEVFLRKLFEHRCGLDVLCPVQPADITASCSVRHKVVFICEELLRENNLRRDGVIRSDPNWIIFLEHHDSLQCFIPLIRQR